MRFATGRDKLIFFFAIVGLILYSASRPFFSVMLGQLQTTMSGADDAKKDDTWLMPVLMMSIGLFSGICKFA